MPDLKNILQQLKDHPVPPPGELFDAIAAKLQVDDFGQQVIDEKDGMQQFNQLKEKEIAPPEIVTKNIFEAIAGQQSTNKKVVPFTKYVVRIAAAIIALAAVWGIYKITFQKNKQINTDAVTEIRPEKKSPDAKPLKTDTAQNSMVINEKQTVTGNKRNISKRTFHSSERRTGTGSVEGYDFSITNNDLLGSFASFDYRNLPDFITEEETRAVQIKTDQSTSITVSEGMVTMMKKMYKTKRNGKYTWKAKKERKKLQRWRKSDANFFDKNPAKNPMDPFDLAEFIF